MRATTALKTLLLATSLAVTTTQKALQGISPPPAHTTYHTLAHLEQQKPLFKHLDSLSFTAESLHPLPEGVLKKKLQAAERNVTKDTLATAYLEELILAENSRPDTLNPLEAIRLAVQLTRKSITYKRVEKDTTLPVYGKEYNNLSFLEQLELGYGDCSNFAHTTKSIFAVLKTKNTGLEHIYLNNNILQQECNHSWPQIITYDGKNMHVSNYDVLFPKKMKSIQHAGRYEFDSVETDLNYHMQLYKQLYLKRKAFVSKAPQSLIPYVEKYPEMNVDFLATYKQVIEQKLEEYFTNTYEGNDFLLRNFKTNEEFFTPKLKANIKKELFAIPEDSTQLLPYLQN